MANRLDGAADRRSAITKLFKDRYAPIYCGNRTRSGLLVRPCVPAVTAS